MDSKIQNNIIYFFIFLFLILNAGFFKTYLIHFPDFKDFNMSHHFHGMVAMSWILLLNAQAFLIRKKKYSIHRNVGKLSYIIMPLFLVSLFFVTKTGYDRALANTGSVVEAIASTSNGFPDIIYMTLLYILAMVNRKHAGKHMRYMIFTGITMLGPGLGRLLIVAFGIPVPIAIISMLGTFFIIGVIWLIADLKAKKSPLPLSVFLFTITFSFACNAGNHSDLYQKAAGIFTKWFF